MQHASRASTFFEDIDSIFDYTSVRIDIFDNKCYKLFSLKIGSQILDVQNHAFKAMFKTIGAKMFTHITVRTDPELFAFLTQAFPDAKIVDICMTALEILEKDGSPDGSPTRAPDTLEDFRVKCGLSPCSQKEERLPNTKPVGLRLTGEHRERYLRLLEKYETPRKMMHAAFLQMAKRVREHIPSLRRIRA